MINANPIDDITLANVADEPTDTVSSIAWSPIPTEKVFACSSWNSQIRVFDVSTTNSSLTLRTKLTTEHPCLSVCWENDMTTLFAGSIDGSIKALDMNTTQSIDLGHHEGVKDMYWITAARMLCSLGFDKKMRLWDLRQKKAAAELELGLKVFCSDMIFPMLAVGLSSEKVLLINLPNIQKMMSSRSLEYIDSPLGAESQLTSMALSYHGKTITMGAHEGRVNISNIVDRPDTRQKLESMITFKCSKIDYGQRNHTLYPTHGVGFHPASKSFIYTASESTLTFWDYVYKDKLRDLKYDQTITRSKLSPDGSMLAFGLGYDWSKGISGDMSYNNSIRVHPMEKERLSKK